MATIERTHAVMTVSELNRAVRVVLEQQFPLTWVSGEISNLTIAASGHWYFSLKDAQAQVRCVMFRQKASLIGFRPAEGMRVEVRAVPALYEPRGDFQLSVDFMRLAGLGALFEAFERLKAKLQAEGLFDADRKQGLPTFPRQIGIVTSPAAAALRDVLTTLRRRMPGLPVVLYPTQVQGADAPVQIVSAIRAAVLRQECDVLIVCRGGGSIEDLWAFNDENVARAIAACPIPVVSGVGHETDVTIADFVADRRAATPTAAAELVSPNRIELVGKLVALQRRLDRDMDRLLMQRLQQLDYLARRLVHPGQRLAQQTQHLAGLRHRLSQSVVHALAGRQWRLEAVLRRYRQVSPCIDLPLKQQRLLAGRLTGAWQLQLERLAGRLTQCEVQLRQMNPAAVLERGYSIVHDVNDQIVRKAGDVVPGGLIHVTLAKGWLDAQVLDKDE
ncbi:exodeoxyribonuclease VII large subunit [Chitinivorax sp. B]|uniref:exodeoxyribonuclease VII large subunit n=1 Tax=Chitinivorax sp. B TaxID=2502235 RepID=UPI0010FA5C38|nr:exodeoxyribonuclease VII large subunit [Chitinivorax sp. B]